MLLYDYFRSSAAFRVRIALNLKNLQAERRHIHLRRGEQRAPGYLEMNPQGLVPTLVVGERRLTQSLAIWTAAARICERVSSPLVARGMVLMGVE